MSLEYARGLTAIEGFKSYRFSIFQGLLCLFEFQLTNPTYQIETLLKTIPGRTVLGV